MPFFKNPNAFYFFFSDNLFFFWKFFNFFLEVFFLTLTVICINSHCVFKRHPGPSESQKHVTSLYLKFPALARAS